MTFNNQNLSRQTAAMNAGLSSITSPAIGASQIWSYYSAGDAVATIEAANYFAAASYELAVNDFIFVVGSDASVLLQVLTVDNTTVPAGVTTSTFSTSSTIGTGNITDNAVTYAKIQQTSAGDVLIGNPTGSAADVEEITLGAGLVFNGTTLTVDPLFDNHASGTLTSAQLEAMYATPISLIAAPGSGKAIIVDKFELEYVYVTTAYATNAGSAQLTYGSSAHAAANVASLGVAFTGLTDQTASTTSAAGGSLVGLANTAISNVAVYISNTTAALATGDGTAKWNIWYKVITL